MVQRPGERDAQQHDARRAGGHAQRGPGPPQHRADLQVHAAPRAGAALPPCGTAPWRRGSTTALTKRLSWFALNLVYKVPCCEGCTPHGHFSFVLHSRCGGSSAFKSGSSSRCALYSTPYPKPYSHPSIAPCAQSGQEERHGPGAACGAADDLPARAFTETWLVLEFCDKGNLQARAGTLSLVIDSPCPWSQSLCAN